MAEFESYEYVITPKKDLKNKLMRLGLILLYVGFVIAWLIFGFVSAFIPLLALIPVTTWMLIFFTWRYVNVEYEYNVSSGIITFTKVFGNRSRKVATVFDIRSATLIAPMTDHFTKKSVEDYDPKHEYYFISSPSDPDAYTALFVNENKERCAIYFIAHPNLKKSCRFYNPQAFAHQSGSNVFH